MTRKSKERRERIRAELLADIGTTLEKACETATWMGTRMEERLAQMEAQLRANRELAERKDKPVVAPPKKVPRV